MVNNYTPSSVARHSFHQFTFFAQIYCNILPLLLVLLLVLVLLLLLYLFKGLNYFLEITRRVLQDLTRTFMDLLV